MTVFDARFLAAGWLSVALASGKDSDVPALNKTVCIETFVEGVRLVATDRYVLLHSWVPAIGKEDDPAPGLGIAPDDVIVAIDEHGRAKALMVHLLSLATAEGAPTIEVALRPGVPFVDDQVPTLDGMPERRVVIDHVGSEQVRLRVHEQDYPAWRSVARNHKAVRTAGIALNPEIVGRLSKLGKLHDNKPLIWQFGGFNKAAAFEVHLGDPDVRGVVMPMRVDTFDESPEDDR